MGECAAGAVRCRLGRAEDLDELMALYAAVVEQMAGTAEDVGWEMGSHPSREGVAAAIEAGSLLVAQRAHVGGASADAEGGGAVGADDALMGVLIVDGAQAAGYDAVPWSVQVPDERVGVIHLFAVAPWARGCGAARALLSAAADLARGRGCATLRLDVFPNAQHAAAVYRACGYTDLGIREIRYPTCENTRFRVMDLAL